MPNVHRIVGGSTIYRTKNCSGWIGLKKKFNPTNRSGKAADVGNLLHDAMEEYYQDEVEFEDQIGSTAFNGIILEKEHLPLLESARNMVEHCLDKYDIEQFLCEPFVEYKCGDPETERLKSASSVEEKDIGGSVDMLGISADGKTALVLDYKFGKHRVRAEKLPQLLFYCLCSWTDPKTSHLFAEVEKVVLVVVQPQCSDEADIYETNPGEVRELEEQMLHALTQDTLKLGSWCQYCPCAPYCPEKKSQAVKAQILSKKGSKDLGEAWMLAKEMEVWAKDVKEEAFNKLSEGADVIDLKLVAGSNAKSWSAEQKTLKKLFGKRVMKDPELISPAQAIKLFGKDEVEPFYTEAPEKNRVVHVSNKKEAIVIDPEGKFKDFLAGGDAN